MQVNANRSNSLPRTRKLFEKTTQQSSLKISFASQYLALDSSQIAAYDLFFDQWPYLPPRWTQFSPVTHTLTRLTLIGCMKSNWSSFIYNVEPAQTNSNRNNVNKKRRGRYFFYNLITYQSERNTTIDIRMDNINTNNHWTKKKDYLKISLSNQSLNVLEA